MKRASTKITTLVAATLIAAVAISAAVADDELEPRLRLSDAKHQPSGTDLRQGAFRVYEDRAADTGRVLDLDVVILPKLEQPGEPDPVFVFAGGPGQNVAGQAGRWATHWMRRSRDIVLVSQRGTGGNNRLTCKLPGSDDNLQGYLDPIFDEPAFRECMEELQKRFDLTHYSTPEAMDDVNELRLALGYDKINLYGGSYGTRAELVYLRRHPETVRSAVMNGVAPIAFKNPLFHAAAAQEALDTIFELGKANPARREAFGDLRKKFKTILERLDKQAAEATVKHPATGEPVKVRLSREAFAEALRIIMYSNYNDVGRLILLAHDGNFDAFAQRGVEQARGLRNSLAFGMLLCITCAEDLERIDPREIKRETRGTFLGDGRVRRQMKVCKFWPKSKLPDNYGDPVSGDVPVLLLSGTLDPVTPPRWGAEAAGNLPKSTHVVAPGSHGIGGPCIAQITVDFLANPNKPLDTSCVDKLEPELFRVSRPPIRP